MPAPAHQDLDFDRGLVVVREGKGQKDRITMLPQALVPALREHVAYARSLWAADRAAGRPGVELPGALARKYPRAGESWSWFWVFPADHEAIDPRSGVQRRQHLFEQSIQRAIKRATGTGGSSSRSARTRCATRSRRTCWSAGRTSARSRSCSAMRTWTRR